MVNRLSERIRVDIRHTPSLSPNSSNTDSQLEIKLVDRSRTDTLRKKDITGRVGIC